MVHGSSCTRRVLLSDSTRTILYYSHYPLSTYLLERLAIGHAHDDEKETVVDNTEGELERLKGGRGMARG